MNYTSIKKKKKTTTVEYLQSAESNLELFPQENILQQLRLNCIRVNFNGI